MAYGSGAVSRRTGIWRHAAVTAPHLLRPAAGMTIAIWRRGGGRPVSGAGWGACAAGCRVRGRDEADVAVIGGFCCARPANAARPELKIIGLELISAPDVTECLRLLAAGLGLVRGREVTG